ncbi:MAG: response regulator [Proteobacteria bacterium]|nr:MAG: response regulator [Pseudomonadota bacterium]
MSLSALTPEQLHLDTLREYHWLTMDEDKSFDGLLRVVQTLTGASAVGVSVRSLDAVVYKTVLGADDLLDGRFLVHCEDVIKSGETLRKPRYWGLPLQTPDGLVIGTLFAIRKAGRWSKSFGPALESIRAQIILALEARRADARLIEAKSELNLKSKALMETKRLHRDFISHVSHEMRTPLHAIQGLTELLQDDVHRTHHPKLLANLTKSSQHMLETLNVLLEHAKLESGALRLSTSTFSLKEFLEETLMPFEVLIKGRGLDFIQSFDIADNAMCTADRVRLRQVLNNLISNALKFTEKGSIRVEVEELPGHTEDSASLFAFRIIDTGLGIHRFNHSLLFEPYRQVSGDSSKGGSGLGLSICKRIIECMEGQIGLDSDFGAGSTFWFKIPLKITLCESKPAITLISNSDPIEKSDARDGRILIIEDNNITKAITTRTLQSQGFTVSSAETLAEAVELLDAQIFDLILMDLHLGELSPTTLLHEVRARCSSPIVVISGSTIFPKENVDRAIDDSLQKPYSREDLIVAVDYWIFAKSQAEHLFETWKESLSSLEETCGSDFLHQTITGFVNRHPAEIHKLQRYLDEENWAKLELAAHSMKSTLATLGLIDLSKLAIELENVAPTHDRAHLESLLEKFRIDARRTYPRLLGYVRSTFPLLRCEIAS